MDRLEKIMTQLFPGVDFNDGRALIDDGVLTSLDIVMLVGELNDAFSVSITVDDLVPENFNSLSAINELIVRLGG